MPFVAYGAKFRVLGPKGEREVAAADYFTMPTMANVLKENVLEDEDLLTHVILPASRHGEDAATTKCATSSRTTGRWRSRPWC